MGYLRWAITLAVMVVAAMRGKGPLVAWARRFNAALRRWWYRWLRPSLLSRLRGTLSRLRGTPDVVASGDLNTEATADAKRQYGEAVTSAPIYGNLNITGPYDDLAARLAAAHERERADLARRRDRGAR